MKNLVVLVADSLRYDSVPERIVQEAESEVIPTLASSLHTPTSFASLFTGLEPQNHSVREFFDDLDPGTPTAFDAFENSSFYDGPDSAVNKHIFRSEGEDLDGMGEPFFWMERLMDSHLPYGERGHDRGGEFGQTAWDYIEKMKSGDIDPGEAYREGVTALEEHFFRHVEDLEDRGILDDTLIVLTSDHGELLGERFLLRNRYEHNYPPIRPLVEVPTVFYNETVEAECMRLVDVFPTAFGILGKDADLGDGMDVREGPVREGRNVMKDVKASFNTEWRFKGKHWEPTLGSRLQIYLKTALGDVKKSAYRKGYRPLEEKLREKREDELGGVDV